MKVLALIIQFLFVSMYSYASTSESWLDRPTGSYIVDIEIDDNYVWCSTEGSLVRWDKNEGTYRHFTTEDGLATNRLSDLLIDDNAMLWLGSYKGLHFFDGESFTVYTTENSGLVNNNVTALYKDNRGRIWCGTRGGVSCFDGADWTSYTAENSGLANNIIGDIAGGNDGVVWFTHPIHDKITRALIGDGVSRFDGSLWEHFTSENSGLPSNDIAELEVADDNTLWLSVMAELPRNALGYVPYSFDGEQWKKNYTEHVDAIEISSDGTVWIAHGSGRSGSGLRSFNGERWTTHKISDLFPDRILGYSDIRFDEDGSQWIVGIIALGTHVLYRYDGTSIRRYAVEGPKSYDFTDIAVDTDNRLWFASNAGVTIFDREVFLNQIFSLEESGLSINIIENNKELANRVRTIDFDHDGTAWIGTMFGMWSYNGENWTLYNSFLEEYKYYYILDIVTDHENVTWVLTDNGLLEYDNEQWTEHDVSSHYYSMKIDQDGTKWFISNYYGDLHLASYDGEEGLFFRNCK